MWSFAFAVKRAMHSVYFPILLVLCTVITLFAPILGKEESLPPAGVCDLDRTEISENAVAYLLKNGFVICSDENTMRQKISSGEFDCGVIIKNGFSDRLRNNSPEGTAIFITSPLSFADGLYKNHVATIVFAHAVPAITAEIMADRLMVIGVAPKSVAVEYYRRLALGPAFTFEIENVDSDASFSETRAKTYLMFFASILIFTAVTYSVCDTQCTDMVSLSRRIPRKEMLLFVVLPNLAVRVIGIILSFILSALLEIFIFKSHSVMELMPGLISYTLFILSFSLVASLILRRATDFRTVTVIVLLSSLILCPAYIDLSALWRPISVIRGFLPTYWLWVCEASPLIWLFAIPILALSSAIFAARSCRTKKANNR